MWGQISCRITSRPCDDPICPFEQQFFRDKVGYFSSFEILAFDNRHKDETIITILILLDIFENDWNLSQLVSLCSSIVLFRIKLTYDRLKLFVLGVNW